MGENNGSAQPGTGGEGLRDLMELFQPGRDSWDDPVFAPLRRAMEENPQLRAEFEKLQVEDALIRTHMRGAATPPGLFDRIASRLLSAPTGRPASDKHPREDPVPHTSASLKDQELGAPTGSTAGTQPSVAKASQKDDYVHESEELSYVHSAKVVEPQDVFSREYPADLPHIHRGFPQIAARTLSLALSLCLVFCVTWAAWHLWKPSRGITFDRETLLQYAVAQFSADQNVFRQGAAIHAVRPPEGFFPSKFVAGIERSVWRRVTLAAAAEAVAYDIVSPLGRMATLYVIKGVIPNLPSEPPQSPMLHTATCSAAAWWEEGRLMVLVVQGGPEVYRRHLQIYQQPFA